MKLQYSHEIRWGVLGSVHIAVVFYLLQVLGMQSWTAPLEFFSAKWYFVLPLILGFGVQVGLFMFIRKNANKHKVGGVVLSGSTSSGAMLACCMHNFVAFLPFVGLSGVAGFFTKYQDRVFSLSIVLMVLSLLYMIHQIRNMHACCEDN